MRKETASEWISVPEAAQLKGVAESSVRVAIQTGRLMGAKVGRSYNVDLSLQRELPGNMILEAAYLGRFSRRLPQAVAKSPFMKNESHMLEATAGTWSSSWTILNPS